MKYPKGKVKKHKNLLKLHPPKLKYLGINLTKKMKDIH